MQSKGGQVRRRQSQLANVPAQSHPPGSLWRAPSPATRERSQVGNQAMQRMLRSGLLQPKLTVSQPNDQYEQEADRVAETVMRMPDKSSKTFLTPSDPPHIQRMCNGCKEEEEEVQRKASTQDHHTGFELEHPTGGQPLPVSERSFFEPRFGRDFSHVRVHANAQAAQAARSIRALAYTKGTDVVFDEGQYRPGTESGRKLMAHELAHTIQQSGSSQLVQRDMHDGHNLTAPRFSGDLVLEAVYDNERLLQNGHTGAAVRKLQQALIDAGFSLPVFGVDGDFGSETEAAVRDFQRASGLIGGDVDGIVGPTTMGWLDLRFSSGPTPPGTTPGASTGCTAIRTFNVDIVSLDGSTRNPMPDLEFANTVFDQCCVRFVLGGGGTEDAARTSVLLGGDTDLNNAATISCASPSAEETGLFAGATADFALTSPLRIFYVDSLTSADRAYSIPPFCATGGSAGLSGMAAVSNTAMSRSLAHELGHILFNSANHHLGDTNNLMHPTNTATGEQLDQTTQCAVI